MHLLFCLLISALSIIDVLCQDFSCTSANSLLEGRRRIVGSAFRASNARGSYPASETRLNDDGWCSGLLANDIFDPYIEVDFGMDLILTSVTTQGVPLSITEDFTFIGNRFIERYRIEVAEEDGHLRYITLSANISQPAIFPLGQSRISNADGHRESLPRPVIGRTLRINPYKWNRHDHVCTKLEVFGCPLQECQSESQLHNNPGVNSVTVSGSSINYNDLFNFDDTGRYYCGPTNMRPFTMKITYSSPVLLTEIGIHGYNQFLGTSRFDDYVTSFSLSFSEDNGNFTEYIRDHTGSTEFTVPDETKHYFGLWPPITASSIKITINRWNDQPCMSFLMLGCNYSDVVDHSINIINETAADTNSGLLDDMTVTLTTTEFMTTTTELVIVTATVTLQTATVTVTADLATTPSPSPTQSSDFAASTSCSSDTDNTPIYVAVAIVIVGLLITITVVIVGVLLCRHYQKDKKSAQSLTIKYKAANGPNSTGISIVEVDNDLYGKEVQPQLRSTSPEDDESAQIALYNSVRMEPDVTETADNPQYGDTMKQSDTTANPKSNENVYSYAVP